MHHLHHGLGSVAHASQKVADLNQQLLRMPGIKGVLRLSTCNRVEVYLSLEPSCPVGATKLDELVKTQLIGKTSDLPPLKLNGTEVITHICEVACGLDSMVVGEREISGQLRRALTVAQNEHSADTTLVRLAEGALRISRQVAQLTGLASQGRSVVSIGLDLMKDALGDWPSTRVLLVGTGSYAGATVAALRARSVTDIRVYSTSGRARAFATGHDLIPVALTGLEYALATSDLIVTCRGLGAPVLTAQQVERALQIRQQQQISAAYPLQILDLALNRDVEAAVGQMRDVRLVGLAEVQQHVPPAALEQIHRARQLVAQGCTQIQADLDSRRLDPVVVEYRQRVFAAMGEEIEKLPENGCVPVEVAVTALHRLAARLAHTPSAKAKEAAECGQIAEYLAGMETVLGIRPPVEIALKEAQ